MDGLLAIIFHYNDEWHGNTKQTFWNPLVEEWLKKYTTENLIPGYTYLCELVEPQTFQVVQYPESSWGMYLLAVRQNNNGYYLTDRACDIFAKYAGFFRPTKYEFSSIDDVEDNVKILTPQNQEGYVVTFSDGHLEKIKCPRYGKIHKLLSRITVSFIRKLMYLHYYEEYKGLAEEYPDQIILPPFKLQDVPTISLESLQESLPEYVAERVSQIVSIINDHLSMRLRSLYQIYTGMENIEQREFAEWAQRNYPSEKHYLFDMRKKHPVSLMMILNDEIPGLDELNINIVQTKDEDGEDLYLEDDLV